MRRKVKDKAVCFVPPLNEFEITALTNYWAEEALLIGNQGADSAALVMAGCVQIIRLLLVELKDTGRMRANLVHILATPGTSAEDVLGTRQ